MKILKDFPPEIIRLIKLVAIHFRYRIQLARSLVSYIIYRTEYPQNILFIAGLPKSGTTWLKQMLMEYSGYIDILVPDVSVYELKTGGSHDYDLATDTFSRFKRNLVLSKMHIYGSEHNLQILDASMLKYVVIYRDLRDVAVSYYYYVRNTVWHPQYQIYKNLTLVEGLEYFGASLLADYRDWIVSWDKNINHQSGLMIRYEDLSAKPVQTFHRVAEHFSLDSSPQTIKTIVDKKSFKKLSHGRDRGNSDPESFYRKGTVGDWQNHFTPDLKKAYKNIIGQFLIEFGYEKDMDW